MEERVQFWSSRLTSPKNGLFVFVAENEAGQLVGFASFGNERTQQYKIDSELMAIYILKKFKRGKIGTKLLFEGLKEMIHQGKNSLLVWVLANNPSRRFYESFSPVRIGEKEIKIGNQVCVEIAYAWKDLTSLKESIAHQVGIKEDENGLG